MDLYLHFIDKINELEQEYRENEELVVLEKFNRKYEIMLNKKSIKKLKIQKKKSSDLQQLKREIQDLKKKKNDIIDKYKYFEDIGRKCQNRILIKINELFEELYRLRFKLRCYG